MTEMVTAHLRQEPDGTWDLWVKTGAPHTPSATLPATTPGRLPVPAERTAALARLGYIPACPQPYASGWGWEEGDIFSGGVELVGQVAVQPIAHHGRPTGSVMKESGR
ncbi:hypothetical protein ADK90_28070 [Streptomyces sp. XY413]|uniref:DUF6303 family protein n=1 Tax=unclassified Streptomyces TaxID=2593676 RepID=UPI0006AFBDB5|nr:MULTISPECIES: DUF6303 family protein [unclassified Streptomyces]KOU65099.1 hypothetical protein ADK96_18865 [Streptomyces sp. IGB124]KOV16376.1 hypothetical protein ADK90_28070 [Streptomyces sp. XY413]